MASKIAQSAKQQRWGSDERERQLSFIKGAIQMLRNGQPGAAVRFLRENHITMCLPREIPPEGEGLTILKRLNAATEES